MRKVRPSAAGSKNTVSPVPSFQALCGTPLMFSTVAAKDSGLTGGAGGSGPGAGGSGAGGQPQARMAVAMAAERNLMILIFMIKDT